MAVNYFYHSVYYFDTLLLITFFTNFDSFFVVMGLFRAIICIIFPPLAVLDRGCGAILLVFILTICGWIPGVIAAIFFNMKD
jgi:uncharacterized membrane protein YqaE (UPF0057 family)